MYLVFFVLKRGLKINPACAEVCRLNSPPAYFNNTAAAAAYISHQRLAPPPCCCAICQTCTPLESGSGMCCSLGKPCGESLRLASVERAFLCTRGGGCGTSAALSAVLSSSDLPHVHPALSFCWLVDVGLA